MNINKLLKLRELSLVNSPVCFSEYIPTTTPPVALARGYLSILGYLYKR